jgi:adenosylmethionine-8-amino-7-oxononanoate aminotransferase
VNVGYGRDELAEAAYEQMKEAALLQLLLQMLDADAGAVGQETG